MKILNIQKRFPTIYFSIKGAARKRYLDDFHKKSIQELMEFDANLYKKQTGLTLDWNNLRRYTEKMQWAKMFDMDERKIIYADKYRVRDWVAQKIGDKYLVPLLGVWKNSKDIDFDQLPDKFVLKTNCGSGDIIIVEDKNKLSKRDKKGICAKLDYFLEFDFGCVMCEFHYSKMEPRIIAEQYIECPEDDLPDYKFLCFDGEVKYCWVDMGRYHNHKRNVYDLEWNLQDWNQLDYGNYHKPIPKPQNFDEMINIAKILCEGFSHVRVDLYNIDGKIYFGEMTFTNGSGFEKIYPDSADIMLGDMWKLDIN